MPSLQKNHNKEVRKSGEYITQKRSWLVILLLLALVFAVVLTETMTRGKISPYFDGGWLTYLIHEIVTAIKKFVTEIIDALKDAVQSLRI